MLDSLFPANEQPALAEATAGDEGCAPRASSTATPNGDGILGMPKELAEIEHMESVYMKSTLSALRVLKEIRSGSSTVDEFSLPPLQINGLEGTWKKVPVLEQEAIAK